MNHIESEQLLKTIDTLISKSNGWDRIDTFFETNPQIQTIYQKAQTECFSNGAYGKATIFIEAIEQLLDLVDL